MSYSYLERKSKDKVYVYIVERYYEGKKRKTISYKSFGKKSKLSDEDIKDIHQEVELLNSNNIEAYNLKSSEDYYRSFNISHNLLENFWSTLELPKILKDALKSYNRRLGCKGRKKITFDIEQVIRMLVFERLVNPNSKLATLEHSQKFSIIDYNNITLRRVLLTLEFLADKINYITNKLNSISNSIVNRDYIAAIYDITTYYFESFDEDKLRKKGLSKDNKRSETQVLMGLLIDKDGIPIKFNIYTGNTYEGNTIVKIIEEFKKEYNLTDITVVADAGLNSSKTIATLSKLNLKWIVTIDLNKLQREEKQHALDSSKFKEVILNDNLITYREKLYERVILPQEIKNKVKNNELTQAEIKEIKEKYKFSARLITYFDEKCKEVDLKKLNKKVIEAQRRLDKGSQLDPTRGSITKFITSVKTKEDRVLNYKRIQEEMTWSGFTGFLTNIWDEDVATIISTKRSLWKVEDSFRTLKTELRSRPVFLRLVPRIVGHFSVCYIALFMLKILKKKLDNQGYSLSDRKILDSLNSFTAIYEPSYSNTGALLISSTSDNETIKHIANALGITPPKRVSSLNSFQLNLKSFSKTKELKDHYLNPQKVIPKY